MMRILIVEDEGPLADLLAEVLAREGHSAEKADGRSGLARSLTERVDLPVSTGCCPI